MNTTSTLLAQSLVDAGIETVYGLPGGENVELLDALRRAEIRFVLVRNESSAVFMADVTARLTGKPCVALTTLGPGAANAYVGIAHAWLDRTPVLLITATTPTRLLPGHTHQVLDLQAVFRPVTKHTEEIRAEDVQEQVLHALHVMQNGRPGPVHLSVSSEVAGEEGRGVRGEGRGTDHSTISHSPNLQSLLALLEASHRPVIVTGVGLEPERPYAELQRLAEALQAPVIVTPKAKGALADDHPLAAGVIGLTRSDPAYEILAQADCILAVGFDVVELVKPWQQAAPLIWLATWPNEDPTIQAAAEWVGPLTESLPKLAEAKTAGAPDWGDERVHRFRQKLAQKELPTPAAGRLRPQQVLEVLRRHTPRSIFVSTDVGSHKILSALTWPAYTPNRYMLSNGLSAMGFGLPAAAAASLVLNEPSLCIVGDGGMAMMMGELGMVSELQLPVITVVMNDNALDLIRAAQLRANKPSYGTEFVGPDWLAIAQAHGIPGYRVANEAECIQAIQSALAARKPALIEALIDPTSYPTTPRRT